MVFVPFLAAAISQGVAFIVVEAFQPPKLFLETVVCYFSTCLKARKSLAKFLLLKYATMGLSLHLASLETF